jgi:beta-aspartyl-peptidase (threonine type)
MLVGAGADQFAREQGLPLTEQADLIIDRERALWQRRRADPGAADTDFAHANAKGTVGAVARDVRGRLVAGTSTGGTMYKHPGRVGDSPLIGCGCYADSEGGGVSSTGEGEAIMRIVMAKTAVELLRTGLSSDAAAHACLMILRKRGEGTGGLILIDARGTPGASFTTSRMAYGYATGDGTIVVPEM